MKKLLAVLMILVMVVSLFAACGSGKVTIEYESDNDATTQNTTEESTEASGQETTEDTTEDTTAPTQAGAMELIVTVEDQDGNPMAGVMVQFCDDNGCLPAMTEEDGTAKCVAMNEKVVKIMAMPEGYDYATEQTQWDFDADGKATIVLKAMEQEESAQTGNTGGTQGGSQPVVPDEGGIQTGTTDTPVEEGTEDGEVQIGVTEPEETVESPVLEDPTEDDFDVDFDDLMG